MQIIMITESVVSSHNIAILFYKWICYLPFHLLWSNAKNILSRVLFGKFSVVYVCKFYKVSQHVTHIHHVTACLSLHLNAVISKILWNNPFSSTVFLYFLCNHVSQKKCSARLTILENVRGTRLTNMISWHRQPEVLRLQPYNWLQARQLTEGYNLVKECMTTHTVRSPLLRFTRSTTCQGDELYNLAKQLV